MLLVLFLIILLIACNSEEDDEIVNTSKGANVLTSEYSLKETSINRKYEELYDKGDFSKLLHEFNLDFNLNQEEPTEMVVEIFNESVEKFLEEDSERFFRTAEYNLNYKILNQELKQRISDEKHMRLDDNVQKMIDVINDGTCSKEYFYEGDLPHEVSRNLNDFYGIADYNEKYNNFEVLSDYCSYLDVSNRSESEFEEWQNIEDIVYNSLKGLSENNLETYTGPFKEEIQYALKDFKLKPEQNISTNTSPTGTIHDVFIGATQSEVIRIIGKPQKINKTENAFTVSEQWVYENGYIYFDNYIVTTIQSSR